MVDFLRVNAECGSISDLLEDPAYWQDVVIVGWLALNDAGRWHCWFLFVLWIVVIFCQVRTVWEASMLMRSLVFQLDSWTVAVIIKPSYKPKWHFNPVKGTKQHRKKKLQSVFFGRVLCPYTQVICDAGNLPGKKRQSFNFQISIPAGFDAEVQVEVWTSIKHQRAGQRSFFFNGGSGLRTGAGTSCCRNNPSTSVFGCFWLIW